jgi:hypothetical protein
MGHGLGNVQRRILATLEEAGQPLWLQDLLRRLWGAAPTRSQEESTRRALATLERRGLAWRAFAEWETYADQCARHRVKVWLPQHPPPPVRRRLTQAQVEQVILEVLSTGTHDRLVLTRSERQWNRMFGPQWMPYNQFTNALYKRLARLTGEQHVHEGRLRTAFYAARQRLETLEMIQIAHLHGKAIYIRLLPHAGQALGSDSQPYQNPTPGTPGARHATNEAGQALGSDSQPYQNPTHTGLIRIKPKGQEQ